MARVFTDASAAKLIFPATQRVLNDADFSVAFWIKRTATPAAIRSLFALLDPTGVANVGWYIDLLTTNLVRASFVFTTDKQRTSVTAPALNTWVHVLVTHHNTGLADTDFTFYFNGKAEAGTATQTGVGAHDTATATNLEVGASAVLTETSAPAHIGPIAIWNRALSPTEALGLASGLHPMRFRESLIEVFDLDGGSTEEGYQAKLVLVPGATNPTNASVRPASEIPGPSIPLDLRQNVRPSAHLRARYFISSGLSAVAAATLILSSTSATTDPEAGDVAATLVLTSTSAATDPENATTAGTLVLTSAAVATDAESAAAAGTLVLTSAAVATDPEAGTAAATLVLTSASAATDPEAATSAATLALTSTSAATDPESGTAAGTLVLTSTSATTDPEVATTAATLVLTSTAAASGGGALADASGTLVLTSTSAATDPEAATNTALLTLVSTSAATDPEFGVAAATIPLLSSAQAFEVIPPDPVDTGVTGLMWGWWDRWQQRLTRRQREQEESDKPPITATARTKLVLQSDSAARLDRMAAAHGALRLVGSSAVHVDTASFEEDELMLMALLLEAAAA